MDIVAITRYRSGFSNVPDDCCVGDYGNGSNCLVSVDRYQLPEGYRQGETAFGDTVIYDINSQYCELICERGKMKILTSYDGWKTLKQISE